MSKMPHSHSSPAGVDVGGGGSRTPPATPRKAGKMLAFRIQMLDDSITIFQVQAKALGRVLFDQVCKQLHLLEADYFGLEYQEPNGTKYWLDLEKPVCRQVGLSLVDPLLRFCVKFYTPDPAQLEEEFTRYLFCLQIKRDLAQGVLSCNDNTAALMASYIVQAECGDFVIEDYPDHTYLSTYRFMPHQNPEIEHKIMENHKKHAGQSPAEADLNLLETARRCELYGMKMHPAKDHEGVPLNLAVAHMGILVFQASTKINTFSWAKIRKISFKRKKFLIKLHPEGYGYYKDTVEFFDGRNECKNFWKKCVENHGFFRCSIVKRVTRQKTRVLSRGSSFRYSGKTQKQIVEFVRDNYVKRQTFQRSNSFRQTSSGRAFQGSEGGGYRGATSSSSLMGSSSISAHPLLPLGDPYNVDQKKETKKSPVVLRRAGQSPGSGIGALQRQGAATQSPTSQRRAKSLDAPVISVHRLPPANAFSSKDDTVDVSEKVEDKTNQTESSERSKLKKHKPSLTESSSNQKSDSTDHTTIPEICTDSHSKQNLNQRTSFESTIISDQNFRPKNSVSHYSKPLTNGSWNRSTTNSTTSSVERIVAVTSPEIPIKPVRNGSIVGASVEDIDVRKTKRWPTDKAYFIAKELLMTERTYKKDLEVINVYFREELSNRPEGENDCIVTLLENLSDAHEPYLRDMEERVTRWESNAPHNIGDFLDNTLREMLPLYDEYIENLLTTIEKFEYFMRADREFEQLCRVFEAQKYCYLAGSNDEMNEQGGTSCDIDRHSSCGGAKASQRSNTAVHVCWHRNTTVSYSDQLRAFHNQLSGFLLRKFKNSNGWQKLWVVFTNFCLFFYKSHQDPFPLACLPLLGYSVSQPSEKDGINKDFVFKLQFKNHVYFFRAESDYTLGRWMEVVRSATQESHITSN
ncbi:unnamed protein product [Trichogramma brassicae]|uniref:Moesin/ezrin/radixin homolog 1 n=1 Tax=Trichogramma brassicae TaxID=86971 RepID=A0A6H5IAY4_9HYME|nr:unnamed protein product [Trichogramma brassicae]